MPEGLPLDITILPQYLKQVEVVYVRHGSFSYDLLPNFLQIYKKSEQLLKLKWPAVALNVNVQFT